MKRHLTSLLDSSTSEVREVSYSHMIPLASAVCKDVYVIGADGRDPNGRKPDETYIWSYSSSCQFDNDLMKTAFGTHPAYFRDRPLLRLWTSIAITMRN